MKSLVFSFLLMFSFVTFAVSKGVNVTVELSPAGSFTAKSAKIKGKVSKKGDLYYAKKLYVNVKDLKTGIDLRDEHMQKRIKGSKITVTNMKAKGGKGIAMLEMNGKSKKITFKYKANQKQFMANFKLNVRQDYQLKDLKYLGVGAKDEVTIEAIVPIK